MFTLLKQIFVHLLSDFPELFLRHTFCLQRSVCHKKVYRQDALEILKAEAGLENTVWTGDTIRANPEAFRDVDFLFSTWGMEKFTEEEITAIFPNLRCVFYGAETAQAFARPFLNRGVKVFSAWAANAVPVAEYTLAQILLANKGYFYTSRYSSIGDSETSAALKKNILGNYDVTVSFIGVGQISRLVIKMLKNFNVRIKVCSRSLTNEGAAELGVEKCSLEEVFDTWGNSFSDSRKEARSKTTRQIRISCPVKYC